MFGVTDLNDNAFGDSYLLTIDKNTGIATPINQIANTFDGYGIAFSLDDTLYTGCTLCGNQLYTLDPNSAAILTSVASDSSYEFKGLGIRSDGTIFVVSSGGFPLLYTIDPTNGSTNAIGFVDWPLSDLTFAPEAYEEVVCDLPLNGNWIIESACTISYSVEVTGNIVIETGVVLKVPSGLTLDFDFENFSISIRNGGGVLLKDGGQIN